MSKPLLPLSRSAELAASEEITRRAILEALRSRVELARPLFAHEVDDDAAVLFGQHTVTTGGDGGLDADGLNADEFLWTEHRGWDM
jgi:hypothetical protein